MSATAEATASFHSRLIEQLAPHREVLLNHQVYSQIDRIESIQRFMEQHVFAVWDFMSLLKALQQKICCVSVPWLPPVDSCASRMINEIVLAEETDEDGQGGIASHFELYHRAMKQCGADTSAIDQFLADLSCGVAVRDALRNRLIPDAARRFVEHTFDIIEEGDVSTIAAAFTYGREDLLPSVFQRIVDQLNASADGRLSQFIYYLDRHIGLDGDEHGPMATKLVASLCGTDDSRWQRAEDVAIQCLIVRKQLWDGISNAIA